MMDTEIVKDNLMFSLCDQKLAFAQFFFNIMN